MVIQTIDIKLVREFFYCDEVAGTSNLFWRKSPGKRIKIGDAAGSINEGYYRVKLLGDNYYTSRIIWCLYHGSIDEELEVRHIDGERSNNNISNLSLVLHQENSWSRKGTKGYHWDKARKKYYAKIVVNGKHIFLGYLNKEYNARQCHLFGKERYHKIESKIQNNGGKNNGR